MKSVTIKRMEKDAKFNLWLGELLGSGFEDIVYSGNLSCYLGYYKRGKLSVLANTKSGNVLETFYIIGCHLDVDNILNSLYMAFTQKLPLYAVCENTYYLNHCSRYMLDVLERGKCVGDLRRLPRAAKLVKDFSLKKYIGMTYDSQVVVDLLTSFDLPKITEESKTEDKVEFIKRIVQKANLSGNMEVQLSSSSFVKFDCRNGEVIFTHYTDRKLEEYRAKERLLLSTHTSLTTKDFDIVKEKFPSVYKKASGCSNLVVLRSDYKICRFDGVEPFFDYFTKKRAPYKKAIGGYSLILDLSGVEEKEDCIVGNNIKALVVSHLSNPRADSYTILDVSPIEYNYLRPSVIEKHLGKPLLVQEEDGLIVATPQGLRKVRYQLYDTFVRSLVSRMKLESVRNKLGDFLTEAFELLIKDRQAFEDKYLSSPESIYRFYTMLNENYITLSIAYPQKSLFGVVRLEGKKEDFSEDDIRNAFKYIDSSSKEFLSEIQKLRKSAKGTGVKI